MHLDVDNEAKDMVRALCFDVRESKCGKQLLRILQNKCAKLDEMNSEENHKCYNLTF